MKENQEEQRGQQRFGDITDSLRRLPEVDPLTQRQIKGVLMDTIEGLHDCSNMILEPSDLLQKNNNVVRMDSLPKMAKVACPGVAGAYTHIACTRFFADPNITFYTNFDDVVEAVSRGDVDFGVIPVENSSAGNVEDAIEYLRRENCYINSSLRLKIEHSLCGIKGAKLSEITQVYSHPQALRQCGGYIKEHGMTTERCTNTSAAAVQIAKEGQSTHGCICSQLCAEIYGLDILDENIQDQDDNYTRFICLSRDAIVLPHADIISIALSFPNEPKSLNKLLTQFSIFGLDMSKIQSLPIGGADFNVRFHLDLKGEFDDPRVENVLGHLYRQYEDFQFLGNYRIV